MNKLLWFKEVMYCLLTWTFFIQITSRMLYKSFICFHAIFVVPVERFLY
jgi:hypothetical protein